MPRGAAFGTHGRMSAYQPQRVARLAPLPEIQAWLRTIVPVAPRSIDVQAAAGRVPAVDAVAPGAVPASSVALRDGWAVRSDTVMDAEPLRAGCRWRRRRPGSRRRPVAAPEPMRCWPPDDVAVTGNSAEAVASAVAGAEGVLGPAGSDADRGTRAAARGGATARHRRRGAARRGRHPHRRSANRASRIVARQSAR